MLKDCSVSDPWHDGRTGLLTIDLDALAANWCRLRDHLSPGTDCAGVVKANGYGLGVEPVVRALAGAGCRTFFVAQLPEGRRVRAVAPAEARVFVLSGPPPGCEQAFPQADLIPVLNSLEQIDRWLDQCPGAPAALHLDTGMARLGLGPEEASALLADSVRLATLAPVLVMSHLVAADEPGDLITRTQVERFAALRACLPDVPASLANSSGIFMGPDAHHELVRPGVALYGVNPTPGRPNPMAPVVRLQGRILQVRRVDAVTTVGYGASHHAAREARLATVGIGYADGLPRSTSSGLVGRFRDVPVPLVGRVSMDLTTFDVSAVPHRNGPRPGDAIDLIGPLNPLDDMAARAGTIGYEILTALGPRHARVYLGQQAQEGDPRP